MLRVINSSVGQLKPVFETILANATLLCEANFGNMFLCEGNGFRTVAIHSRPSAHTDWYERHPFVEPTKEYPHSTLARLIETKKLLHIADLSSDRGYLEGYPPLVALVDDAGARTDLLVPMLKEDQLIGAIVIYRTEVRPFTEKQTELVQNFAYGRGAAYHQLLPRRAGAGLPDHAAECDAHLRSQFRHSGPL